VSAINLSLTAKDKHRLTNLTNLLIPTLKAREEGPIFLVAMERG
jgi:hypothetical protein